MSPRMLFAHPLADCSQHMDIGVDVVSTTRGCPACHSTWWVNHCQRIMKQVVGRFICCVKEWLQLSMQASVLLRMEAASRVGSACAVDFCCDITSTSVVKFLLLCVPALAAFCAKR